MRHRKALNLTCLSACLSVWLSACTPPPLPPLGPDPVSLGLPTQNSYVDEAVSRLAGSWTSGVPSSAEARDLLTRVSEGRVQTRWISAYRLGGETPLGACRRSSECSEDLQRAAASDMGRGAGAPLGPLPGQITPQTTEWIIVITQLEPIARAQAQPTKLGR